MLSLRARLDPFAVADLEDALYERRTLLRILAMRRTMFVVPLDLAAVMDAACTKALVPGERRKLVAMLPRRPASPDDVDAWIERVGAETLAALRERRAAPGEPADEARAGPRAGSSGWPSASRTRAPSGVSTRVLFLLSTEGRIARARPLGSWLSSQYRWVPMADWIGELPGRRRPRRREPSWSGGGCGRTGRAPSTTSPGGRSGPRRDVTRRAGRRRRRRGHDRHRRRSRGAGVGARRRPRRHAAEAAAPDGLEPVALLPGLDPTIMGWKERGWYLGPHRAPLFDRNGNAGPTVWVGGRAVGAWSQRAGGEVVTRLLEAVRARAAERIDAAAERLTAWMDGVRVTPRFPTPLDRELAGRTADRPRCGEDDAGGDQLGLGRRAVAGVHLDRGRGRPRHDALVAEGDGVERRRLDAVVERQADDDDPLDAALAQQRRRARSARRRRCVGSRIVKPE